MGERIVGWYVRLDETRELIRDRLRKKYDGRNDSEIFEIIGRRDLGMEESGTELAKPEDTALGFVWEIAAGLKLKERDPDLLPALAAKLVNRPTRFQKEVIEMAGILQSRERAEKHEKAWDVKNDLAVLKLKSEAESRSKTRAIEVEKEEDMLNPKRRAWIEAHMILEMEKGLDFDRAIVDASLKGTLPRRSLLNIWVKLWSERGNERKSSES